MIVSKSNEPLELQKIINFCEENNLTLSDIKKALEPSMYATIPVAILERKDLSATAKVLYAEIVALAKRNGECFATNKYIADRIGLSDTSINRPLRELVESDLIKTRIDRSKKGTYRKIYVCFLTKRGSVKEQGGGLSKSNPKIEIDKIEIDKENTTNVVFGKAEINDMFEYWQKITEIPISSKVQANRNACNNLIKKYGQKKLKQLIDGVGQTQQDQYAPRIADFIQLQSKLSDLLVWGKRKINNNQVVQIT